MFFNFSFFVSLDFGGVFCVFCFVCFCVSISNASVSSPACLLDVYYLLIRLSAGRTSNESREAKVGLYLPRLPTCDLG